MEEVISSPQTPCFGFPKKIMNFTEQCKIDLDDGSKSVEKKIKSNKDKKEKSKNKRKKRSFEQLHSSNLSLEKENPYYELMTKKIKLRNDFDRKHTKKFLGEVEEAFKECDLNDELSEDEF